MNMLSDSTPTVNPLSADLAIEILPVSACPVVDDALPDNAAPPEKVSALDSDLNYIVDLYVTYYGDESTRSFAIAKKVDARFHKMRKGFPGWSKVDFDHQCGVVRNGVRLRVSIKPESIRVADWLRAYTMRELARKDIGDLADSLTMYEYLAITGKGLKYDPVALSGEIRPCYLDLIRDVAEERSGPIGRVSGDRFKEMVADTVARVAFVAQGKLSPEQIEAAESKAEATKASAAKAASVKKLTDTLNDGFAKDSLSPASAAEVIQAVCNSHGVTLPQMSSPAPIVHGFDPATATVADCELLAGTMFATGRYDEMVALRDRLSRMIAAVDNARAKATASV